MKILLGLLLGLILSIIGALLTAFIVGESKRLKDEDNRSGNLHRFINFVFILLCVLIMIVLGLSIWWSYWFLIIILIISFIYFICSLPDSDGLKNRIISKEKYEEARRDRLSLLNNKSDQPIRRIGKNKILETLLVIFVIGFVIFKMFQTTDEIGYLGAGKVGRQVLIQTLDHFMEPKARVTSEFYDRPFILRLILGEPLRTTIRFDFQDEKAKITTLEMLINYLNLPHETITQFFDESKEEKIILQDKFELGVDDFKKSLIDKNVKTIEDFFAGYGFYKYEVYIFGQPKFSIDLRNVKNVGHVGT